MISIEPPQTASQESISETLVPDLTSLLDILFILLFFFMLTIGSIYQSLDIQLPSSASDKLPFLKAQESIVLEIGKDNYALDGKILASFSELQSAVPSVLQKKSGNKLIIAGEKDISMQRLLEVLSYLQSQGIRAANILLQNESQ